MCDTLNFVTLLSYSIESVYGHRNPIIRNFREGGLSF